MALLIKKRIDGVLGTLSVDKIYTRFFVNVEFQGKKLYVWAKHYLDKKSFLDNDESHIVIKGLPNKIFVTYDRATDGVDILLHAHNEFIDAITTEEFSEFPKTDPETGEQQFDQETGKPLMELRPISPKFCEPNEVSIIELD